MNSLYCKVPSQSSIKNQPDFSIARFIRFLKRLKLRKLLKKIKDPRVPAKIKYQLEVITFWALSVFFFRRESVNSFYAALEKLSEHQRKNIWYFLGCKEGSPLPHRTVITDCLSLLDPDEIIDGVWPHHHKHLQSSDVNGKNSCPYCLQRDRGTNRILSPCLCELLHSLFWGAPITALCTRFKSGATSG